MLSTYGVDAREALWGTRRIGVRRLLMMLRWLPSGSAVHRSTDPRGWDWDQRTELLAGAAEISDRTLALLEAVHSKDGGGRVRESLHIQRPTEPEEREMSSSAELDLFVAQHGGRITRRRR